MNNLNNAAFFTPPFQGGMISSGRLLTRANAGVKPPFQFRPEKQGKKGGETPHGYWLHAALPNTTSLRTYPPLGRHTVLALRIKKCVNQINNTRVRPAHITTGGVSAPLVSARA